MKIISEHLLTLSIVIIILGSTCFGAYATTVSDIKHGVISIAFDDGLQSVYDHAYPALASRGMTATYYAISSKVDTPNYMTVSELLTLQNAGNEIGSHSVTHAYFPSLSPDQIRYECSESKIFLESKGLKVNNFAYPYGAHNLQTDSIVSQYYRSGRSAYIPPYIMDISNVGFNLTGYGGERGDNATLSGLQYFVDTVYNVNGWAIIFFHNLTSDATTNQYSISTSDFSGFLDYVSSKHIPVLTVNEALNVMAPSPSSLKIGPVSATSHSTGALVTLSSSITDLIGVDYVIPSWNNSGIWINQTAIGALGSKSFVASFTDRWNTTPGSVVSAVFYAKDTSGNWAASSKTDFVLNTYAVTLSANQTGLIQEDTLRVNLAVTKNGSPFTGFVTNATRDGSLFACNITASFNDREIIATSHLFTISSLFDTVAEEDVAFTTNTLNVVWANSAYTATLFVSQSTIIQKDTVSIYLNVTKNGLTYNGYLANITKDNVLFASNASVSFSDTENAVAEHTYKVLSLYDVSNSEIITFETTVLSVTWAQAPSPPTPTPTTTAMPTLIPTPRPTATADPSPKPTMTPSPTATVSTKPTTTITQFPKPSQGLPSVVSVGITAAVIIGVAVALLLLIRSLRPMK